MLRKVFIISVLLVSTSVYANLFVSKTIKTAVCEEDVSLRVDNDSDFSELMDICLNQARFCTPKVEITPSGRGSILYVVKDYDPSPVVGDIEENFFVVRAYPDSGILVWEKAAQPICD